MLHTAVCCVVGWENRVYVQISSKVHEVHLSKKYTRTHTHTVLPYCSPDLLLSVSISYHASTSGGELKVQTLQTQPSYDKRIKVLEVCLEITQIMYTHSLSAGFDPQGWRGVRREPVESSAQQERVLDNLIWQMSREELCQQYYCSPYPLFEMGP